MSKKYVFFSPLFYSCADPIFPDVSHFYTKKRKKKEKKTNWDDLRLILWVKNTRGHESNIINGLTMALKPGTSFFDLTNN